MNELQLQWARDAIQHEIDLVVQDQGNHTELSYLLQWLTTDKVAALMARIEDLRTSGESVTYNLLTSAIAEEETV